MGKDLLRSLQELIDDTSLKPNEKVALMSLILKYNIEYGYAFPKYDQLKIALSTKRNDTVSNALKSLVAKNYIVIEKAGNNKNKYFIQKYLYFIGTEQKKVEKVTPVKENSESAKTKNVSVAAPQPKPVDSNGNKPLENQVHIDDVLDPKVIEISEYTGFNKKQSNELLAKSNGDKAKVINAFEYMRKQKNVNDPFHYTLWAIENNKIIIKSTYNPQSEPKQKELKFNNFEAREYDYDKLEKKLLGWDDGELSNDPHDYRVNIKKIDFEGVC